MPETVRLIEPVRYQDTQMIMGRARGEWCPITGGVQKGACVLGVPHYTARGDEICLC